MLTPIFDLRFSESDYGFVRYAHPADAGPAFGCPAPVFLGGLVEPAGTHTKAIKQVQRHVKGG